MFMFFELLTMIFSGRNFEIYALELFTLEMINSLKHPGDQEFV